MREHATLVRGERDDRFRLERGAGDPLAAERYERKATALRRKIREAREAEMTEVRSNAELVAPGGGEGTASDSGLRDGG